METDFDAYRSLGFSSSCGGIARADHGVGVSRTSYVTTGVQFISPLAIIIVTHVACLGVLGGLKPGFALIGFRRSFATAGSIALIIVLTAAFAPMPAEAAADRGSFVQQAFIVISCLMIVALVVGVAAAVVYVLARVGFYVLKAIERRLHGSRRSGDSRLYDFASVAAALFVTGVASLEGVPGAFSFSSDDRASSTLTVAAAPERLWREVAKATSPDFALPPALQSIPKPIAVLTDEGAEIGARRIVRFKGRQGEGDLVLQVTRRTDREAVFKAMSDSSPIAKWVAQKALTFQVEEVPKGSQLTVSLDYDRHLSPAWFFRPYIRFAAFLAVNVLARDTKERAEKTGESRLPHSNAAHVQAAKAPRNL